MNYYLLIPTLIIFLMLTPIFFHVKGSYNVFDNKGAVGIFLFGMRVKWFTFYLDMDGVKLRDDDDKKDRDFDLNSAETLFYYNLIKQISNKTKIKLISVLYNIGFEDAFQTACFCGVVNLMLIMILTRVKCSKPTTSMLIYDNPSFNSKVFQVAVRTKFSITIFDVVYSLIVSLILTNRDKSNI